MANYIGNIPSTGEFKKLDSIASSFNGTTTQFNLTYNSVSQSVGGAEQLIVSLNGVIQEPLSAYTLGIGGSAIVFASAPQSGDTCHIVLFGGVGGTVTPSDQSVTVEKLASELKDYYEDEFTANGSTTDFTLSREAYSDSSLLVSIDGIVQPTSAYDASGTTLTISPALPNGTNIRVIHMGVKAGIYIPQTGTVGLNELNLSSVDSRYYTETEVDSALTLKANLSGADFTGNVSTTGTLGVGTDSPSDELHISGANPNIRLETNTTGETGLRFFSGANDRGKLYWNGTGETGFVAGVSGNSYYHRWELNGSERMRLDASGNLLVGTTSSSSSTAGIKLTAAGTASFVRAGVQPVYINRLTSDGDLAVFAKDGSTVGSIGVGVSSLTIGKNDTGIRFADGANRINPWNLSTNAARDGVIDLGENGGRFKDLYLSGGVYVGGTGAANYFDDYEEGTFTPTFNGVSGNPTVGYTSQNGNYVKIGSSVFITMVIGWSSFSGGSGLLRMGNLPFAMNTSNTARALGSIPYVDAFTGLTNAYGLEPHTNITSATNGTYIYYKNADGNINTYVTCANVKSSGNLQMCLFYRTT